MKVVVQKCLKSSVTVDNKKVNDIDYGLMLLVGFKTEDKISDLDKIVKKIVNLRIFEDDKGIMNKSILDVGGSILCISQFTLYADLKKGNRPSYINAMKSDEASILYDEFCKKLNEHVETKKGLFGSNMSVELINLGPTTIIIDSKDM